MNKTKSKTVLKSLNLFEELSKSDKGLSNTEIANRVNLNPSTSHRLLSTLESQGYVSKEGKVYRLGHKTFQLKVLSQKEERIRGLIRPFLIELEEKFGFTVNLGVRRGRKAIPIEIIKSSAGLVVDNNLDTPTPLHASALGKCLLAFSPVKVQKVLTSQISLTNYTQNTITEKRKLAEELEKVKDRGYAIDDEEYFKGVICIGIPCLMDKPNSPSCALSVSAPASTVDDKKIGTLVSELKKTRKHFLSKFS